MAKEKYFQYWGKSATDSEATSSYHLLAYHCLDTAAVCRELLTNEATILSKMHTLTTIKPELLVNWMGFLMAVHDIGKFADGFQNQCPNLMQVLQGRESRVSYSRHDSLGYRFCEERKGFLIPAFNVARAFDKIEVEDMWDLLSPWIMSVTGHHGQPPNKELSHPPLSTQFPNSVVEDIYSYIQDLCDLFLPAGLPFDLEDYDLLESAFSKASWLSAGIAVAADWIGSNQNWFVNYDQAKPITDYWQENALPQAKIAVQHSGLLPAEVSKITGMQALFPKLVEFNNPTPLQQLAQSTNVSEGPQIFLVEEVTGGGKTEAALTLAHRIMAKGSANGIYMALPTMATANAMHRRVRAMYKNMYADAANPSLILAHSARQIALGLEEKNRKDKGYGSDRLGASKECSYWLADSRKKALLAHVGVGTIDQALLAILPVRHQSLRVFGLADKVLVVDEVHACDAYVHSLLCTLLRFHTALGGSAILLSATLPRLMREQLINAFTEAAGLDTKPLSEEAAYPLLTHFSDQGLGEHSIAARKEVSRRVIVQPYHSENDVDVSIQAALDGGGCVCWVRNTVHDALNSYQRWVDKVGEERVSLFHARFTLFDRLNRENDVMNQFGAESQAEERRGKLLIATQVVEQSLDIDFDYMVSDLAPIDLIIQRAGRLHRHERKERGQPVLGVFMPEVNGESTADWFKKQFPKAAYVYPHHGQLWLTARWLLHKSGFSMPEDARDMIESVYSDAAQIEIPVQLQKVEQDAEGKDKGESAMGIHNSLNLEAGYQVTLTTWQPDEYTPTRLGDPTIIARLAKWQNGDLKPFHSEDSGCYWELSQISVRQSLLSDSPSALESAINTARESMPDGGRYCVIVPVIKKGDLWQGVARDPRGNDVSVKYNDRTGLRIEGITNESD